MLCILLCPGARSEECRYIRVVGSDNTALMQTQKYVARDLALRILDQDMSPEMLEQALLDAGIPAACTVLRWAPNCLYPTENTLYITLGKGAGRNWWGVLCSQDSIRSLFDTQKKSGISFYAAHMDRQVSFPILSLILSVFNFRSPQAPAADSSGVSAAASVHPAWNWWPSASAFQSFQYRCTVL